MSVQRPLRLKYLCVARILNARPLNSPDSARCLLSSLIWFFTPIPRHNTAWFRTINTVATDTFREKVKMERCLQR